MNSSVELGLTLAPDKTVPAKWEYSASVEKVKALITSFKNVSSDMLHELWVAREKLSIPASEAAKKRDAIAPRSWSQYCEEVGVGRSTANRWLSQYDHVEKKKIQKPTPSPEDIRRKQEAIDRMAEIEKEDEQEKSKPDIDVEDLLNEARQEIKTSEEVQGLQLDGPARNLAQGGFFKAIDRYVYAFPTESEQLEAVQNLIKKLKAMAISLNVSA